MTRTLFLAGLLGALSSHAGIVGYAVKQGFRQGSLLLRTEDVDVVLKRPGLDPQTETYLKLSKAILAFAQGKGMKTGRSYTRYAKLDRPWVTQIVSAAPKDKLEPYLFQYPIVGALPYKGFFDEDDAIALEAELAAQNLDVARRPVDAFSTTGWLPDPVLSTMFDGEARFTELLFHELTHGNFYFPGEADFNEAFATWTGYELAKEFLASPAAANLGFDPKEAGLELERTRAYQNKLATAVDDILAEGARRYAKPDPLKERDGFFAWIRERLGKDEELKRLADRPWNNAMVLGLATYLKNVPKIEAYAKARKTDAATLLKKVTAEGPKITKEILGSGTN